jgi:hypothetical protein
MNDRFLSNAYLVAKEEGGAAVFVDSGASLAGRRRRDRRWL